MKVYVKHGKSVMEAKHNRRSTANTMRRKEKETDIHVKKKDLFLRNKYLGNQQKNEEGDLKC